MRFFRQKSLGSFSAAAILLLLSGVCIYGAFMGADRAAEIFNSSFAGVCWCILGFMFLFVAAGNLIRRKLFIAAVHLGCAAIIIGGLLGSERVCGWRGLAPARAWTELREGQTAKLGDIVMKLRNIRVEYYPVAHSMLAWKIYLETCSDKGEVRLTPVRNVDNLPVAMKGFVIPGRKIMCEKFDWILPDSFTLPQLIWPNNAGWEYEPLVKNRQIDIVSNMFTHLSATIEKFYDNLRFDINSNEQIMAIDSDDGRVNRAVSLVDANGRKHYVFSPGETVRLNVFGQDGRMLMYLPVGVNRGGRASPFAVILRLRRDGTVMTGVTAAVENDRQVRFSLLPLYETEQQWISDGRAGLLFRLEQPEKQVFAECVFDDEKFVRIGINRPAGYGGYDFTISDYDIDGMSVKIFARRNCGIFWVWSGFVLLGAGVTGWCVLKLLNRRRAAA